MLDFAEVLFLSDAELKFRVSMCRTCRLSAGVKRVLFCRRAYMTVLGSILSRDGEWLWHLAFCTFQAGLGIAIALHVFLVSGPPSLQHQRVQVH